MIVVVTLPAANCCLGVRAPGQLVESTLCLKSASEFLVDIENVFIFTVAIFLSPLAGTNFLSPQ